MTILVTGATGLIGARLLPRLAEAGFLCRAILRAGRTAPEGVEVVEGDLLDPATLAPAVEGVSAIVHLAAVFRTADTDLIWKSNFDGTCNLIDAAKVHAPRARFILASTSNVYDADGGHPGREDDPVNPQPAYPASKLAAEDLLRDSGLTHSILRFSFVYSDGDGHLEALPGYVSAAGWHPAKCMSMVHHRDLATSVRLALSGALDGQTMNVSDDASASIYELVDLAGGKVDSSAAPLANPWHLRVDNTLAHRLGFDPSVRTVHQAVRKTCFD